MIDIYILYVDMKGVEVFFWYVFCLRVCVGSNKGWGCWRLVVGRVLRGVLVF